MYHDYRARRADLSFGRVRRALLSLARARNVRASHRLEGERRLAIRFTWE